MIYRQASAVFFTTEREQKLAQQTFALPHTTFIVVPYGVDRASAPAACPVRPELLGPADQKVALF